jgi:dihydroxyacetone kinase-like protein
MSGADTLKQEHVLRWLREAAAAMQANRDLLTRLDQAIGDGDHGINMDRGFRKVADQLAASAPARPSLAGQAAGQAPQASPPAGTSGMSRAGTRASPPAGTSGLPSAGGDIGAVLKAAAMTLISSVGGASGPLYGTFFLRAGTAAAGREELAGPQVLAMLEAGLDGVRQRGRAQPGEKTMVDALQPAMEALRAALGAGKSLAAALADSAAAAERGAQATVPMVARKGRASYLGERSAGHQDPGAVSSWLLLDALRRAVTDA